jgi:hypothetical protein
MMLQLVQNRLMNFMTPVKIQIFEGNRAEGPVIKHDGGPCRVRPAIFRWIRFGNALAECEEILVLGMRVRIPVNDEAVYALFVLIGDLLPNFMGYFFELLQRH